jgi:hypothetical protein
MYVYTPRLSDIFTYIHNYTPLIHRCTQAHVHPLNNIYVHQNATFQAVFDGRTFVFNYFQDCLTNTGDYTVVHTTHVHTYAQIRTTTYTDPYIYT